LDVCDQNTIPYATNIASAEILITAIDSGALDYREWNVS
jgi:methylglyoxal synthase